MTKKKNQRRTYFRLIAIVLVPLVLLSLLEGSLRLFGYGYSPRFTVKENRNGQIVYRENLDFTRSYFPKTLVKFAQPFAIPYPKAPKTYRVFVLGASAAEGWPAPPFGFARILEVMLRSQFPNVNVEVINTSVVAINSHVVRKIAREIAGFQPDLFVIYLGNNEVIGPYGPGTIFLPFAKSQFMIRAGMFLQNSRTGQMLNNLIRSLLGNRSEPPQKWSGLEMFLDKKIRSDDPRLEIVYEHYQRNLQDMIAIARKAGAPVALCTVGSNLRDIAPFASLHHAEAVADFKLAYEKGVAAEKNGQYEEAIQQYQKASQIDDRHAELHYRLGRCLTALQRPFEAQTHFLKARDFDALRFRADSRINQVVRQVAEMTKNDGVFLVDSVETFKAHSPNGLPGKDLFYEHVHLTFQGHYLLAREIYQNLHPHLPDWMSSAPGQPEPVLSEAQCREWLAYTKHAEHEAIKMLLTLVQKAPFTYLLNYRAFVDHLLQRQQELAQAESPQGWEEERAAHERALQLNPHDKWIHFHLGKILLHLEKPKEAALHFRRALERMPEYTPAARYLDYCQR